MTMTKQPPCCARFASAILREKGELGRLARAANRAAEKGRPVTKYTDQIAKTRVALASAEQYLIDHEADHAEDRLSA